MEHLEQNLVMLGECSKINFKEKLAKKNLEEENP